MITRRSFVQETNNEGRIIRPHLCDRVEVSADYSEFIFHIREGLRWSDGVEFTADDILWWWQHERKSARSLSTRKMRSEPISISSIGAWAMVRSACLPSI